MTLAVRAGVELAPLTTLELGGPARFFVEAADDAAAAEALLWATTHGVPVLVLGGGSNLVIADQGFDGLVLRMASRGLRWGDDGIVEAAAGEPWDALVAAAVSRDLAGLECLSGIPGLVGATPIQNVGAYGQEVSDCLQSVRVLDRRTGAIEVLTPAACGFGYRDSAFKRAPDRHLVLGVTFALRRGGAPTLRYAELKEAVDSSPTLDQVRATVIALRRRKSMVIDPDDPNRRSVGSFFMNPIVSEAEAAGLPPHAPRFPAGPGKVKLAAGWLIENAGITRGLRRGAVGISSRHALALVHHGGGTTREFLFLAAEVRDAVALRFGLRLLPEPTLVGATL